MIYNSKKRLYLDIALYLNRTLYENKSISIFTYEMAQEVLLKQIKACD